MPNDGVCTSVDNYRPYDDYPGSLPRLVPPTIYLSRLDRFGDRSRLYIGTSQSLAELLPKQSADLVFIDASHTYDSVKRDIDLWLPIVRQDGILAGHDYDKVLINTQPQVIEARKHSEVFDGYHSGVFAAVKETFGDRVQYDRDFQSSVWWVSVD